MIPKAYKMIKKIRFMYVVCVACIVLAIGSGILTYNYLQMKKNFSEFKTLYGHSVNMAKEVASIQESLSTIDNTLNQINKFSAKLKVIARIKNSMKGKSVARKQLEPQKSDENLNLEKVRVKLKDLKSEADTQEHYLAELDDFFSQEGNETLLASVPSVKPGSGRITSRFGFRRSPAGGWHMHEGVDIGANYGTSVVSPADGMVESAGYSPGYGQHVVIDHGFGLKTIYAHASKILVKAGQFIKRGSKLAMVGRSGHTRGVHLHYEVRLDNVPVDPLDFMLN